LALPAAAPARAPQPAPRRNPPRPLELAVRPPFTYRLPRSGGGDGVMRSRRGVLTRLLHLGEHAVVVHAWQPGHDRVVLRAIPAARPVPASALQQAVERMRFALAVDDDLSAFARRFRGDPLIGEVIHHKPWHRPRRRPFAWEALAWAVTEQLIEAVRAHRIQRRIVGSWGPTLAPGSSPAWGGRGLLRDVPSAAAIAARAPAEIVALDLVSKRAMTLIRCAREVASGRVDPARADDDRRLRRLAGVGPWTLQVLGQAGRGEPDSLPAGDLAYVKLVGVLASLGRRATVDEVEEFFAPYEPYRGLAGSFALSRWHGAVAAVGPQRLAPDAFDS
jgi:3-methyladenine DNA glycosylase/8-oxoguanine DNA glycosylase